MMMAQQPGYGYDQPTGPPAGYGTQPAGYPPQQAGYPPQQAGYPPQQAGYPPQQAGYPPQQAGYPPQQAGYPPQQAGYPPAGQAPSYQQGAPPPPAGAVPPQMAPPSGSAQPPGVDTPSFKGTAHHEDVMDNPNAAEPSPTAPPMEKMEHISGYDNVTFDSAPLPPPSYDEATRRGPQPDRGPVTNLPVINEDQAREALLQHVAENCCYGKGAAQDMTFRDLKSSSAFHYTLETFCESRSTAWAYEPFTGQPIDGPMNGPAPGPWDIAVNPSTKFQNGVTHMEVPHTASVKPCHDCAGIGRTRCFRCLGRGRIICNSCNGSGKGPIQHHHDHHHGEHHHNHHHGHGHRERCTWCHGTGRKRCYTCHGHGQVNCKTCGARGQLKCYIKLTIKWTNHPDDHVVERTSLPDQLIRGVSGQLAFEEEYGRVWPITHFPDQSINEASRRLVEKHGTAFPTERILLQRHRVRIVPVTEAMYQYKDKDASFFVYGFEHKVHAPDYPQQCCCGCVIL